MVQAGQLRVNMGNVHYGAGRLPEALRCWRAGLEAIPEVDRHHRAAVLGNVGVGLARLGRYQVQQPIPFFATSGELFTTVDCHDRGDVLGNVLGNVGVGLARLGRYQVWHSYPWLRIAIV